MYADLGTRTRLVPNGFDSNDPRLEERSGLSGRYKSIDLEGT